MDKYKVNYTGIISDLKQDELNAVVRMLIRQINTNLNGVRYTTCWYLYGENITDTVWGYLQSAVSNNHVYKGYVYDKLIENFK